MILTCPECGTQYAVKDGAIPEGGRKVRCASCGHSWHQDPPQATPAPPSMTGESDGNLPEPGPDPIPVDAAGPAASAPDAGDWNTQTGDSGPLPAEPPSDEDFALAEPPGSIPVQPPEPWVGGEPDEVDLAKELPDAEEIEAVRTETREDRKRNLVMGILIAIGLVVVIALALWFLAPDSLRQSVGFGAAAATPLQIAPGTPERQKLASGNELVVVSGRIINPSGEAQQVPPIEAQLRDSAGKPLYSWTIAPPARSLPPGGSASFHSAKTDVPASGIDSTVTLTLKS